MSEWRLFGDEPPVYTTAEWYLTRERAPHLEQPGHRERLLKTEEFVRELATATHAPSIVDLGCGDGGLLSLLGDDYTAWGYDLSLEAVSAARSVRKVSAKQLDIMGEDVVWATLVVATEVLEHLVDPHAYVRRIAEHSSAIVASSPVNETDRSHYEFHTWAWDMGGYRQLLTQGGFSVLRHEQVQGFQIISGVRRGQGTGNRV